MTVLDKLAGIPHDDVELAGFFFKAADGTIVPAMPSSEILPGEAMGHEWLVPTAAGGGEASQTVRRAECRTPLLQAKSANSCPR